MRYVRVPSILSDMRLSFSFLRTTPARNPRAECGCQPISFIIAAIVAPVGDWSIAMMRDCFVPAAFRFAVLRTVGLIGFAAFACFTFDRDVRLFAVFDIGISLG